MNDYQTACCPGTSDRLKYRPDWGKVKRRWAALWARENTDRPALDIKAPRPAEVTWPQPPHSPEDGYLDPAYVSAVWEIYLERTWFLGEAVPTTHFMAGYALGCGPNVRFAPDTVWHPHLIRSMDEPPAWHPGPDDPWRQKLDRLVTRMNRWAKGKCLVGAPFQIPPNDLLPVLRGVEDFLADLGEDVDRCTARMKEMWPLWHAEMAHFEKLMYSQGEGCVLPWPGMWHPTGMMWAQSDVSCMISGDMFERYVLPDLDLLGEQHEFVWYHLDGSGAVRHLPQLFTRRYLQAVQYVPSPDDPPNGPKLMPLYRQVQAAGRCLDLLVPWENVEYLIRHLRPEGLLLRTRAPSRETGLELLDQAAQWAGRDCSTA